jgi:threonine efflux protein
VTTNVALTALLAEFGLAYGCMLMIPGPNTFLVLGSGDGKSATRPLLAAAGVTSGATLASLLAASSAAALPHGAGFRTVTGVLVAASLFRAALRCLRTASSATRAGPDPAQGAVAPFGLGLGASLLNPVSVPYFASFFVSHACGVLAEALTCALVFAMAGVWFSTLGLVSARVGRLPMPAAYRRLFACVLAGTLTAFALRQLWTVLFP